MGETPKLPDPLVHLSEDERAVARNIWKDGV